MRPDWVLRLIEIVFLLCLSGAFYWLFHWVARAPANLSNPHKCRPESEQDWDLLPGQANNIGASRFRCHYCKHEMHRGGFDSRIWYENYKADQ